MPAMVPPSKGYRPVVGEKVIVGQHKIEAYCRFIGETEFAPGEWIGIEMLEPAGKNDGSVQGKRYFDCRPNHGIFVRQATVAKWEPPVALADASIAAEVACGGQVAEVPNQSPQPQRAGSSEEQQDLLREVETIRATMDRLMRTVQDMEARTAALERATASGCTSTLRVAKASPCDMSELVGDPALMEVWMGHFGTQLRDSIWTALRTQIDEAIGKAIANAASELKAAELARPGASAGPGDARPISSPAGDPAGDPAGARRGLPQEEDTQAAVRIQARVRGVQSRGQLDAKKKAVSRLQRLVRCWLETRKSPESRFAAAVVKVTRRNHICLAIFSSSGSIEGRLGKEAFHVTVCQMCSHINRAQSDAIFDGYIRGTCTDGVDLVAFMQIVEAISAGDEVAAQFADMALSKFKALGGF